MKPLNALTKRDMLAAKKFDPDQLRAYAEEYFSEDRFGEAFEFYRKAGDAEGVQRTKKAASELADTELLWRIEHFLPEAITPDDWRRCAERALELGKPRNAAFAFRHIGDADRQAAAEKEFANPSPVTGQP